MLCASKPSYMSESRSATFLVQVVEKKVMTFEDVNHPVTLSEIV